MTNALYIKESIVSRKANERMVALVGFSFPSVNGGSGKEGILKISASGRPGRIGYLTLTLIVDTEDDEATKGSLAQLFDDLTEKSFSRYFGRQIVKIIKFPLGRAIENKDCYVQELNLYFSSPRVREDRLVKEKLIPALSNILSFSFGRVEWWPKDLAQQESSQLDNETDLPTQFSIKALFRKWFSSKGEGQL